jgi:hypothetical protein
MRGPSTNRHRGGGMLPSGPLWSRTNGRGLICLAGRLGGVWMLVIPNENSKDASLSHLAIFAGVPPAQRGERPINTPTDTLPSMRALLSEATEPLRRSDFASPADFEASALGTIRAAAERREAMQ